MKISSKPTVLVDFCKFHIFPEGGDRFYPLSTRIGLIKLQALSLAQVFSCEFCEISWNTFFTEHFCTTASDHRKMFCKVLNTSLSGKEQKQPEEVFYKKGVLNIHNMSQYSQESTCTRAYVSVNI